MNGCAHIECSKKASHHIGFRAWPKAHVHGATKPLTGAISLMLCHAHAIEATKDVDKFITDEGWGQICFSFVNAGLVVPERSTVKLFVIAGIPKTQAERMT